MNQVLDIMKVQMLLSGTTGAKSYLLVSVFERLMNAIPGLPLQSCCRRKVKHIAPQNKEIKAEILFERQKEDKKAPTFFQNRMDAVIHSVSKVPAIRHLLGITHHDYLPYEFDSIMIEPDLYFQLIDMKHSEGNIEALKFRLFCYEIRQHDG